MGDAARGRGLGVTGWVRNSPTAASTAHVEGEPDRVNDMVVWLRKGPPAARVRDVAVRDTAPTGSDSFEITG